MIIGVPKETKMSEDLATALADLKEKRALEIARDRLNSDEDPMAILSDVRRGAGIVGERFASGEYFIPDLVYSGEIFKQITEKGGCKAL